MRAAAGEPARAARNHGAAKDDVVALLVEFEESFANPLRDNFDMAQIQSAGGERRPPLAAAEPRPPSSRSAPSAGFREAR